MVVIAVDDEKEILDYTIRNLKALPIACEVYGFYEPNEAYEFAKKNNIDIAFLDIEMPVLDGISLAKLIKANCPKTHIIFLTGYREYAISAFEIRASGYVLKPATTNKLAAEMENIKRLMPTKAEKKLCVQAFGNFEVFCDGVPVKFARSKTKELFAYLVDRKGASLTMGELSAVLWEDSLTAPKTNSFLRQLISDLTSTLKSLGLGDIIIKHRNQISVNTEKIECDYYAYINGDTTGKNAFGGEYMSQYSWAEYTEGGLLEGR